METVIYITMLIGLLIGFVAAHIEYRRKIVKLKNAHQRELSLNDYAAFVDGWERALADRTAVRAAFNKLHIVIR